MYKCYVQEKSNRSKPNIGNQSNTPAMTAQNATPRTPCIPALAPTAAPFARKISDDDDDDAPRVKLTGAGAVDAFKDMLTFGATKVGPPPAPTLLTLGARYGMYASGFKAPGNVPVRFKSGTLSVATSLFWYEVASATKAKTSG